MGRLRTVFLLPLVSLRSHLRYYTYHEQNVVLVGESSLLLTEAQFLGVINIHVSTSKEYFVCDLLNKRQPFYLVRTRLECLRM